MVLLTQGTKLFWVPRSQNSSMVSIIHFTYKNFDLNIFFSGSYGNKVFNQVAIAQNNPQNNSTYFTSVLNYAHLALIDPAGSASDVNNVYVTNPNTTIVGLRNDNTNDNNRPNNLFIEDGSFLRCKNITLGLPVARKYFVKNILCIQSGYMLMCPMPL